MHVVIIIAVFEDYISIINVAAFSIHRLYILLH